MSAILFVGLLLAGAAADAKPQNVVGEVVSIEGTRVTVRATGGATVVVASGEATRLLRARPGAATLEGATPIGPADLAVGDRVLAGGGMSDGVFQARQVVVMSRGDLADKQAREREDWKRRGVAGVVAAVDPDKREITIRTRSGGAEQKVVLSADEKAVFRRYAPDSVRFADARPSTLAETRAGDHVRALGDRGPDGRVLAEQVVSGTFRTVLGAFEAADARSGEIRIASGAEKLALAVVPGAPLRRLTPELVKEIKAGANLADLLDRMPALDLSTLKPGDRLALSTARGGERSTALAVVGGIEPLLASAPAGRSAGVTLMPGLPAGALDMGMSAP